MKRVPFLLVALTLVLACSDTATEPALDLQPQLEIEGPSFASAKKLAATQRTVSLSPLYYDVLKMRWSDIAGHPYAQAVHAEKPKPNHTLRAGLGLRRWPNQRFFPETFATNWPPSIVPVKLSPSNTNVKKMLISGEGNAEKVI